MSNHVLLVSQNAQTIDFTQNVLHSFLDSTSRRTIYIYAAAVATARVDLDNVHCYCFQVARCPTHERCSAYIIINCRPNQRLVVQLVHLM